MSPSIVAYGTAGTWMTARLNGELHRLGDPGRANVTRTVRAGDAAQRIGHLVDLHVGRRERVDPDDAVALAHAAVFSRRVREDAAHTTMSCDARLLLLEQHPDAAVPAADAAVELLVLLRREQLAVRIVQLAHESVRRLLEDLGALQRIDVLVRDDRRAPDRTAVAWRAAGASWRKNPPATIGMRSSDATAAVRGRNIRATSREVVPAGGRGPGKGNLRESQDCG